MTKINNSGPGKYRRKPVEVYMKLSQGNSIMTRDK